MISRYDVEKVRCTSANAEVEKFLDENKSNFFTKEEIYQIMPADEQGVSLFTIGSVETALREMVKFGIIEMVYVRNVRYYGYRDRKGW